MSTLWYRRMRPWTLVAVFLAGSVIGAVSAVEIVPADRLPAAASGPAVDAPAATGSSGGSAAVAGGSQATTTQGTVAPGASTAPGVASRPGAAVAAPDGKSCAAGKNGGATGPGVTASEIKLATTVVQSGLGSAFLGEMRYAMDAVVTKVNREGGICGRRLSITYKDDGWNAQTGAQYLRNFIKQGYFGIPVGASSEGLQVVIKSGDLDNAGMPVIGTDGLAIDQYARADGSAQPWVWPIATATASSARIMVGDAYRRGARTFGVVFDSNYHFGKEAATAFNAEVKRLTGKGVDGFNRDNTCQQRYCGIQAGQNSYSSQSAIFNGSVPEFIGLFLEPETALTWMQDPNTPAASSTRVKYGYGGAQPLFTYQFESQCGDKCDQLVVWTGFKPNVERYASDPAVREFVDALRSVNPQADPYNQFSEGAYIGMELLVDALRAVGPNLTRERLQAVLNTMSLRTGLSLQPALTFRPDTRYANITMQAFTMQFKGTPGGWRTGVLAQDPNPQAGAGG